MHKQISAWSDETRFLLVRANSEVKVCFRFQETMQPSLKLLEVKVADSLVACHAFEPAVEGRRGEVRLIFGELKSSPDGAVWKLGEGCQLRCLPRSLTMVENYETRHQKTSST
ncbi:hypothetical protein TNCV_5105981 [Trichonephila clavipes]|nr:hypothetical protein TNCV_5105981 [Trichonephila clavipes]